MVERRRDDAWILGCFVPAANGNRVLNIRHPLEHSSFFYRKWAALEPQRLH